MALSQYTQALEEFRKINPTGATTLENAINEGATIRGTDVATEANKYLGLDGFETSSLAKGVGFDPAKYRAQPSPGVIFSDLAKNTFKSFENQLAQYETEAQKQKEADLLARQAQTAQEERASKELLEARTSEIEATTQQDVAAQRQLAAQQQRAAEILFGKAGSLYTTTAATQDLAAQQRQATLEEQQILRNRDKLLAEARRAAADRDITRLKSLNDDIRTINKDARDASEKRFTLGLQLESAKINEARDVLTDQNRKRDDARAVINSIISNFGGAELEKLPEEMKLQFESLETQAGLPKGFISQGLRTLREQTLGQQRTLAEQKAADKKAQDDIMNQIRLTQLGIQQARLDISRERAERGTEAEGKARTLNTALEDVQLTTGSDGFVNTQAYKEYRARYIKQYPGKAKEFDQQAVQLGIKLNPNDASANDLRGLMEEARGSDPFGFNTLPSLP